MAMAELANERRWATDAWREPARNANSFGAMSVYFLAEHLAGYAAIADGAAAADGKRADPLLGFTD